MKLQLQQSAASSLEFPDDDSENIAAADEVEASQSSADGDLDNAELSDQAASTSGLAGLDPATRVTV